MKYEVKYREVVLKKIGTNFPICCIFENNMLAYLV